MDDIKAIINNVKNSLKNLREEDCSIAKEVTTFFSWLSCFLTPIVLCVITDCWWICLFYPIFGFSWLYFMGKKDD
jgi:hypothetical protein